MQFGLAIWRGKSASLHGQMRFQFARTEWQKAVDGKFTEGNFGRVRRAPRIDGAFHLHIGLPVLHACGERQFGRGTVKPYATAHVI